MIKKILIGIFFTFMIAGISAYFIYKAPSYRLKLDGKLYVVNKLDRSLTIIDLDSKQRLLVEDLGVEPHEITVSNDGSLIFISDYGNHDEAGHHILVVSKDSGELIQKIELSENTQPHGMVLAAEHNRLLLTCEGAETLITVDLNSGEIDKVMPTGQKGIHMVTKHPEKPLAYVSNINSNTVSVIDYLEGKLEATISCGKGTEGLAITKNGQELWVTNRVENTVSIIETENNTVKQTLSTNSKPVRIAISPDGKYCVVSNASGGNITVYDVISKKLLHIIDFPGSENVVSRLLFSSPTPVGLYFHPSEHYLFASSSNADQVVIISTINWKIIGSWNVGDIPDGILYLNDT